MAHEDGRFFTYFVANFYHILMSLVDPFPRTSPTSTHNASTREKEMLRRVSDASEDLKLMAVQAQAHERENMSLRRRVKDLEKQFTSTMREMAVLREAASDYRLRASERDVVFEEANGLRAELEKAQREVREKAESLAQHRERCTALTAMATAHVRTTRDKCLEIEQLQSLIRTHKIALEQKDDTLGKARAAFEALKAGARKKIADADARSRKLEKKLGAATTLARARATEVCVLKRKLADALKASRRRAGETRALRRDNADTLARWRKAEAQRREDEEYSHMAIEGLNQKVFAARRQLQEAGGRVEQLQRQNAKLQNALTQARKRKRTPSLSPTNDVPEPPAKRRRLAPPRPTPELLDDDVEPLPVACSCCALLVPATSRWFTMSSLSRKPWRPACSHRLCATCRGEATRPSSAFAWTCPVDGCGQRFVATVAWQGGQVARNVF